jgi:hypothetical protein
MTLMLNCNESFFDFPKSNFNFITNMKVLRNLANLFSYHKDKCMVRWTPFGVIVIVFYKMTVITIATFYCVC